MHRIDTDMTVDTFRVFNDDIVGFLTVCPNLAFNKLASLCLIGIKPSTNLAMPSPCQLTLQHSKKSSASSEASRIANKCSGNIFPNLCELHLKFFFFECMGIVFQQSRGATIGNQLSPALCGLTVAAGEQMWDESFQLFVSSHRHLVFLSRYVDNRFTILPESFATLSLLILTFINHLFKLRKRVTCIFWDSMCQCRIGRSATCNLTRYGRSGTQKVHPHIPRCIQALSPGLLQLSGTRGLYKMSDRPSGN